MDYTDIINESIREAAAIKPEYSIRTAESILPLMDVEPYLDKELDIRYAGLMEAEKLDIFYPELSCDIFPVLIEVHGGGWYFGQKRSIEFQPFLVGLKRGFACVSLGYTLSPKAHYPLAVLEIKAAIRFLRRNAARYRIDPDRIVLWGGSAGAHLAALAAASSDTGYLQRDLNADVTYSAKPNVLALWYGCFDMGKMRDDWMAKNFMGMDNLADAGEDMRLSDPVSHLTADACPTFLQHGTADMTVDYSQSVRYYDKLKETAKFKGNVLELLEGYGHADSRMFSEENINRIFDFAVKNFP